LFCFVSFSQSFLSWVEQNVWSGYSSLYITHYFCPAFLFLEDASVPILSTCAHFLEPSSDLIKKKKPLPITATTHNKRKKTYKKANIALSYFPPLHALLCYDASSLFCGSSSSPRCPFPLRSFVFLRPIRIPLSETLATLFSVILRHLVLHFSLLFARVMHPL
jgi:hypothetical protein